MEMLKQCESFMVSVILLFASLFNETVLWVFCFVFIFVFVFCQSGLPDLELEAIDNQFGQPGAGDQIPWANNTVAVNQNKPEE